jgi:VanZ family protein
MFKFISDIIKWFEKHYALSYALTILIAIFIFYISSKPFYKGAPGPEFFLKPYLYHFGIFALLAFFFSLSLIKGNNRMKSLILIAILFAIAYGILDELHQFFVPNRSCSIDDFVTDSTGIISAAVFYISNLIWREKKRLS